MKIESDVYYVLQGEELKLIITRLDEVKDQIEFVMRTKTSSFDGKGGDPILYFD